MWCSDHGVSHRSPLCKTKFSESFQAPSCHLPRQQGWGGGTTAIQAHVMGPQCASLTLSPSLVSRSLFWILKCSEATGA